MESLLAPAASLLVMVLFVPLLALLGVALLMLVGHLIPGGPTLSRVAFHCPFSKRRATVEFLSPSGGDKPTDVLSCSVFAKPYHIKCKKGCLELTETVRTPSPLMARFALLADGATYRSGAEPGGHGPDAR